MLDAIAAALARLQQEGGAANRLLLSSATGWVLVTAAPQSAKATVQVAAGRLLPGDDLAAEHQQALLDAGFRRRSAADPWVAERAAADVDRLAAEALGLRDRLFGPGDLDLQLGHAPRLENAALLDRMRVAGRDRDTASRNRLYHGLVRARLLVTLAQPATGPDLALRPAGDLHGEPVAAVFTDWDTLLRFDPRGLPAAVVPGIELFPLLASRRFVSVLVNPMGTVGGELYRHEVETIAVGCRRLSGTH
ncbi:MAG: SseB family protein [Myxococcales bacterium]|nr:SseB family protein [Myxococcales bacterium]